MALLFENVKHEVLKNQSKNTKKTIEWKRRCKLT